MIGALASRAASREATTVEDEVTFWALLIEPIERSERILDTYNSWDGELVLLSIVEELEDIVANDDTSLAAQNVLDTHACDCSCVIVESVC